MLVDELLIPHRSGTIRVPLDERVTVFAGLDRPARQRMAALLVDALAGEGPASVHVRDGLGQGSLVSRDGVRPDDEHDLVRDPTPPLDTEAGGLARLMVVRAQDLGLEDRELDLGLLAERSTAAATYRQLARELAALEAGAAERARLVEELERVGEAPTGQTGIEAAFRALDAALALVRPRVEQLIERRRAADELLVSTVTASRLATGRGVPDGDPAGSTRGDPDDAGTGLLAALAAWRTAQATRAGVEDDPTAGSNALTAAIRDEQDAAAALTRATADLTAVRHAARSEIVECDTELHRIARELGLSVTAGDPGLLLTRTIESRMTASALDDGHHGDGSSDPEQSCAVLLARIAGLPTADDVTTVRVRVEAAEARLRRLAARCPPRVPVDRVRNALLGRAAALRPTGFRRALPLVLDDPLRSMEPEDRFDLLDIVGRVAQRAQVVILTEDHLVTMWARHRAGRGEVRLVDLAEPTS